MFKKCNECKELKSLVGDNWREIAPEIDEDSNDIREGDYRLIHEEDIDDILKDELLSDLWMLGCFSAWFIADITGLDLDAVEKAQKDESFELLGHLMAKNIDEVVSGFVSSDGYGHHFNSWDGSEENFGNYYVFRT